ncbi:DUF47 domain-containing protein [Polluticoccus soli]|uniref:DUF47 domain-containing protein n=1 Tax=Polluticoccus soli TaxID=3034150 RepID=UPI0023E27D83|nr:DUF47 family protein [Flavipsychrobacter sp. JY13-12]
MSLIATLLSPGSSKFYALFNDMAITTTEMSRVFLHAAHEKDRHILNAYVKQLNELETENEYTTHKLNTELGRNFITPFDREDIHSLAAALNKIADFTWKLCKQMHTYAMKEPDRHIQVISDHHYKFIKLLAETTSQLKNRKGLARLTDACDEMQSIISKCGDLLDAAITNLFSGTPDVILAIKRIDQYDTLQELLNKSSDAVNTIETMLIKYS